MKPFLAIILLVIFSKPANSQTSSDKIDSVFKFYFFVFEMESTDCCPREKYPDYYYAVVSKTNDTFYLNKYAGKALDFIQKISRIKAPVYNYEEHEPVVFAINPQVISLWKSWYINNKDKLRWSKKKNKPIF